VIASLRVRTSEVVTGVFLAVEGVALVLLTLVAATHPARGALEVLTHPVMLDHGVLKPTPPAVIALAVIAGAWSTSGASFATFFGEELKEAQRRIGRVVAWAAVVAALTIALPMLLTVLSIGDLKTVLAAEAPLAVYLKSVSGPGVEAVVSFGVAAALFNNLIAAGMAFSRMIYSTARDGIWPRPLAGWIARLDGRLQTPVVAMGVLVAMSLAAEAAGLKALTVFMAADLTTLMISLAALMGRRRGLTGRWFGAWLHPLVPLFGLGFAGISAYVNWIDPDAGRPSLMILGGLCVASLAAWFLGLRRRLAAWDVAAVVAE
jgi:amino acid transporter